MENDLIKRAEEIVARYSNGFIPLQFAGRDLMKLVVEWMKLVDDRITALEEKQDAIRSE